MPKPKSRPHRLTLLVPAVLLTGCLGVLKPSPPSAPSAPPVPPPQIPSLPAEARQPPTPELCSPTCSAGLQRLLDSWLR